MENASKALIMAGSVLIALMIIGALLLMFSNLTSYQNTGVETTREAQVVEFNNQYETFNRKNVRGSDLYSLLNRVVDYNRRKSTEGTGSNDEGQYLAYEPMIITVDLNNKKDFSFDGTNYLIESNRYEINSIANEFESNVKSTITNLESTYGSDSLNNLVTGVTKIFIDDSSTDKQKEEAIRNFNNASKKVTIGENEWNKIAEDSAIRKAVYQYYEYVQFKRAKFNCEANSYSNTNVRYNTGTGRIIEMNFKFTGKFE